MRKINVAILYGGKSAEHEVSLRSAKNVIAAIDKNKYHPILVKIKKSGPWYLPKKLGKVDVVFPILHGPFGEDGTVQGALKLAGLPFVGCGVLGSAVGMDKDVMKRLLRDAGLPIGKFLVLKDFEKPNYKKIVTELGLPFFLKPANMGSSVGVHKVKNETEFKKALADAFLYDRKVILEEFIDGREIECAVLGNDEPKASLPGEIIVNAEFYSYSAKYLDKNGATLAIPAELSSDLIKKIQTLAIKTFTTLEAEGLSRVDFFLSKDGDVLVNEINTMPGFTSISMYPKLWEASGIGYTELIDRLIQLAIERFGKEKRLNTNK